MPCSQWYFADFRLDPDNACLWRGTQPVALPPKAFDVLHYLVTHPDRLVTKDTLLDAVWPETTISDTVVRVAIGEVRRSLGDAAQAPRFIATVHRRGYRFVAPVAVYPAEAPGPAASETPIGPPTPAPGPFGAPVPPLDGSTASARAGGLPYPGALVPPEAERRPLTVLWCALVGSTRLASHLDPEDVHAVLHATHQRCAEVIQRFDGYVAQYVSDGLVVYFGYPVAHEDDAQRAVWAGLGLLEALPPLTAQHVLPPGQHVAVRLGVHTGLVVLGDIGAGARHEPLALGETPHIAASLHTLAAPNALLVSAATYQRLAGSFICEGLGAQWLSGLAHPVQVYRVLRPSGVQSRLEWVAAGGLTPLVGRTSEVEIVRERWARVKAGMGQVVMLMGEAGIGKSRLVQVLKDHVAPEAPLILECRGVPYDQHTALAPIIACLQRWAQWYPGTAPAAALVSLEALLTQAQLPLEETVPLLADLMALPLPAAPAPRRPLPPEQQRERTLAVLLALIGGVAVQQPVLVIVEDLHWLDPSTLELLGRLLDQVPTTRLYLVLTCRPEFQVPWGLRAYLTPLTLHRLTPSHTEAMVAQVPGAQRLSTAVQAQIVARSDGIPLFVEEVTKAVLEMGPAAIRSAPDVEADPGPALTIPVTLHEALLARLDRLGSAKGVAQLGAAIGREFPYVLLQAVAALEDEALQRALATLVAAEVLYQRGQPPQAIYTFKHVLIQEAAYESVLKRVRRQLHQRIMQVLETQCPETVATAPALLAHHALQGEVWEQAVASFRQAGEQAVARCAYREAVAAFEQALRAVQYLPDDHGTHAQAIDLRLALREALYPLGEPERLLVALQEADELAKALGDPHRTGWIAVYLLAHFGQAGDLDRARTAGHRALTMAAAMGEVGLTVAAQYYLGHLYHGLGDYRQAIVCMQQNVASLHGTLRWERFGLHGLLSVHARSQLVCYLAECGAFAKGQRLAEEAVQIAEMAQHPYSRVMAYWGMGVRHLCQGEITRAIVVFEHALQLVQEADLRLLGPKVTAALGAAYALTGRTAAALRLLRQAMTQGVAMRYLWDHALRTVWLGEAYLRAGYADEASTQAQRALACARMYQQRGYAGYALRLLGEIHAHRRPPQAAQAETAYREALALADALGMRPLQAHCHRGLGTLYATTGQWEQARAELATAIELYRTMEMTFWLPETEAALAQVEQ